MQLILAKNGNDIMNDANQQRQGSCYDGDNGYQTGPRSVRRGRGADLRPGQRSGRLGYSADGEDDGRTAVAVYYADAVYSFGHGASLPKARVQRPSQETWSKKKATLARDAIPPIVSITPKNIAPIVAPTAVGR